MERSEAEKKLVEYSQRFYNVFRNTSTTENTKKANSLYQELLSALTKEHKKTYRGHVCKKCGAIVNMKESCNAE